jgi:hypothetical protein
MAQPEQFAEPGMGPDYRIGGDSVSQTQQWRVDTPPFAEDGSIPDRRLTMAAEIFPNIPATGGGINLPRIVSTFDLPID